MLFVDNPCKPLLRGLGRCSMLFVLFVLLQKWTTAAQTLMVQVARRSASVLKRRKSRNRMEVPAAERNNNTNSELPASNVNETPNTPAETQKEGDNEVIYYMDEPHAIGEQQ